MVKLYAPESGSELIAAAGPLAVSALARVEVPSALWRKARVGEISADRAERLVRNFVIDLLGRDDEARRFGVLDVRAAILDSAAAAVDQHGLRAYDAVQLASAVAARGADPEINAFACFDDDLREAAARSGFALIP